MIIPVSKEAVEKYMTSIIDYQCSSKGNVNAVKQTYRMIVFHVQLCILQGFKLSQTSKNHKLYLSKKKERIQRSTSFKKLPIYPFNTKPLITTNSSYSRPLIPIKHVRWTIIQNETAPKHEVVIIWHTQAELQELVHLTL